MLIKEERIHHYCLVKNLSRLLLSQVSKAKRKEYFCTRCFNPFGSQEVLFKHLEYCKEYNEVELNMPKEGTILKFKTITNRKRFLSSFTLTLLNRYKRVNQILKVVILNNIKNTSQLAFVIISNALIMKYMNQN